MRVMDGLLRSCLLLILALGAAPDSATAGERHAGTVLAVNSGGRAVMLDEFGANAERRTLEVRLSSEARVLLSERDETATEFDRTFKDTPIGLSDIQVGDFIVVELAGKPNVASLVIVTLRGRAGAR